MNLIAEPDQITPGLWLLAGMLVLIPLVMVVVVPRRWLWHAVLGWLFAPVGLLFTMFVLMLLVGAGSETGTVGNALLGVGYIGIFVLVPWFVIAGLGIGLGFLARLLFCKRTQAAPVAVPVARTNSLAEQPTEPSVVSAPPIGPRGRSAVRPYKDMTTEQLHDCIRSTARALGVDDRSLPLIGYPENGAPYAYVDQRGLQLGYFERGEMFDCRTTRDLDEMLYWVFDHVTYDLAGEYARQGVTHVDQIGPRLLERQGELLARLNPRWHARWRNDPYCQAGHYRREAKP